MVLSPTWLDLAKELALQHTIISPYMIHRRLHISRLGAELLLRALEREGVVGPRVGDGSREVLAHA